MSPPRPVLALLLAPALLLACARAGDGACPGTPIGRFAFSGARSLEADPAPPSLPACAAATGYGAEAISFSGTLSADPESGGAAFCPGRALASNLFGARAGDAIEVETTTGGASVTGCGAACAATLTVILRGTLASDEDGVATGFAGSYVERLAPAPGSDCGVCTLPCEARWDVTGAPAR